MKRSNFESILEKKDYVERSSSKPVETFIPNQAMNLKELVLRFERGQRLNVHENFRAGSNFTESKIYEEDFEDAPPDDIHDIVDVQQYYESHKQRKSDFKEKLKSKNQKTEAKPKPEDSLTPSPE